YRVFQGQTITYYLEEIQPEQLQYTIYNTSLDQNDILSLRQNDLHVSNPAIDMYHPNNCFSFLIDPQTYELRKIALFENNKYFIALWNIVRERFETYYETLCRTFNPKIITNHKHRNFYAEKQSIVIVNEPKGMIGIYQTSAGLLDIYVIDEDQQFYNLAGGIQISAWYGNTIPDIKFMFFIKDKEEICFVQTNGTARIFNLITNQFLPGTAYFPINARDIVCTPDGSCIVAFVEEDALEKNISEENALEKNESKKNNTSEENKFEKNVSERDTSEEEDTLEKNKLEENALEENILDKNTSKINTLEENTSKNALNVNNDTADSANEPNTHNLKTRRAYIYFCSGFGKPASKVIQLPPIISTLELIQFSCMENQIHLTTLDVHTGIFQSLIIKITHEKTQYSFQRKFSKQSLAKVRAIKNFSQDMELEGNDTSFICDVKKGENLVIMREKRAVLEIYSDKRLKVSGAFQCMIDIDSWMEFRIEPKTKLNGFVDAYKLMFEKYPIDNIIDPDQKHIMNLQIALDLNDNEKLSNYKNKFQKYVADTFDELKRSTNKPATSIEKYGLLCLPFSDFNLEDLYNELDDLKKIQLGEWIIQLCILIPIQIAVARNNLFQPLCNGLTSFDSELTDSGASTVDGIAQNISFGWYEGIFKYFGDRPVKVVSSMGE
ncbi:11827_t:CDS:2, partial [Gigaspora rosea]